MCGEEIEEGFGERRGGVVVGVDDGVYFGDNAALLVVSVWLGDFVCMGFGFGGPCSYRTHLGLKNLIA